MAQGEVVKQTPGINIIEHAYYRATLEARLRLGLKPLAKPIPGKPEYDIPVPVSLLKVPHD